MGVGSLWPFCPLPLRPPRLSLRSSWCLLDLLCALRSLWCLLDPPLCPLRSLWSLSRSPRVSSGALAVSWVLHWRRHGTVRFLRGPRPLCPPLLALWRPPSVSSAAQLQRTCACMHSSSHRQVSFSACVHARLSTQWLWPLHEALTAPPLFA
jgi:hypothetical protein